MAFDKCLTCIATEMFDHHDNTNCDNLGHAELFLGVIVGEMTVF